MTLAALRTQARRYARVDATAADNDQVDLLIQEAVTEFTDDVGGFPMDVHPAIAAAFDTETYQAIHVKIVENGSTVTDEDVVITGTAREDTTGTQVATDLQVTIRAMTGATGTETVTWSAFKFTIDWKQGNTAAGDSIVVSAPTTVTYEDAQEMLGLGGTTSGTTITTGGFPEDCTQYITLPTNAVNIERVEWDKHELKEVGYELIHSPESQGDPLYYAIRGPRLYLSPSPDVQDSFDVWYRGEPTAINFAVDTDVPTEIPLHNQIALVHLVASKLADEQFDDAIAAKQYGKYHQKMRKYRIQYANRNTVLEDGQYRGHARVPKWTRTGFS